MKHPLINEISHEWNIQPYNNTQVFSYLFIYLYIQNAAFFNSVVKSIAENLDSFSSNIIFLRSNNVVLYCVLLNKIEKVFGNKFLFQLLLLQTVICIYIAMEIHYLSFEAVRITLISAIKIRFGNIIVSIQENIL